MTDPWSTYLNRHIGRALCAYPLEEPDRWPLAVGDVRDAWTLLSVGEQMHYTTVRRYTPWLVFVLSRGYDTMSSENRRDFLNVLCDEWVSLTDGERRRYMDPESA